MNERCFGRILGMVLEGDGIRGVSGMALSPSSSEPLFSCSVVAPPLAASGIIITLPLRSCDCGFSLALLLTPCPPAGLATFVAFFLLTVSFCESLLSVGLFWNHLCAIFTSSSVTSIFSTLLLRLRRCCIALHNCLRTSCTRPMEVLEISWRAGMRTGFIDSLPRKRSCGGRACLMSVIFQFAAAFADRVRSFRCAIGFCRMLVARIGAGRRWLGIEYQNGESLVGRSTTSLDSIGPS